VAFSSIAIMIGAMLYITLLGSITTIVANLSAEKTKKIQQLEGVLSYLKKRMVSKSAFKQVREYYEFMWDEAGAHANEPQQQLDKLPDSLQVRLACDMHKNLLAQIPVFCDLLPEAAFSLVKCWQRIIYVPNDVIVQNIGDDERLYILIRGKVRLFVNTVDHRAGKGSALDAQKTESVLFSTDLQCGNFFGERAMLGPEIQKSFENSRYEKKQRAVAVTFSELLFISKESFATLVETHSLEQTVEKIRATYRSRRACMRWRVAIVQVRVVVRLSKQAKLHSGKSLHSKGSSFFGRKFSGGTTSHSLKQTFSFRVNSPRSGERGLGDATETS